MKYKKEERKEIGRRIYDGEMDRYAAAEEYGISEQTAREYIRLYRKVNGLPAKRQKRTVCAPSVKKAPAGMDELKGMTKEELIAELVKGGGLTCLIHPFGVSNFFNSVSNFCCLVHLCPSRIASTGLPPPITANIFDAC